MDKEVDVAFENKYLLLSLPYLHAVLFSFETSDLHLFLIRVTKLPPPLNYLSHQITSATRLPFLPGNLCHQSTSGRRLPPFIIGR